MLKKMKAGPFVIFLTSELWSVLSELLKRYIRTLKTLYSNFENVITQIEKYHIIIEFDYLFSTKNHV